MTAKCWELHDGSKMPLDMEEGDHGNSHHFSVYKLSVYSVFRAMKSSLSSILRSCLGITSALY